MQRLNESYDRVTPAIQQMIEGKQVLTPETFFTVSGNPDPVGQRNAKALLDPIIILNQ
jgi:hypothetical protein